MKAVPLISIPFHDVKINIQLKPINELLIGPSEEKKRKRIEEILGVKRRRLNP